MITKQLRIIESFIAENLVSKERIKIKDIRLNNIKAYVMDVIRQRQIKILSPYISHRIAIAFYVRKEKVRIGKLNDRMFANELNYRLDVESQEYRRIMQHASYNLQN
jgi:Tol biopolymer transport system component